MKRGFSTLALVLLLGGCVNFGDRPDAPAVVHYVLNDPAPAVNPAAPREDAPVLLVLDTTAGSFYDGEQLVFSRSPGTRGQYQFARWTERPGKRFADLMRDRLDRLGAYRIATAGGQVRGDLLLDTELVEFYHDATAEPGEVRVVLRAELVDLKRRALLGRRTFEQRAPLAQFDAAGAAEASGVVVGQLLDALAEWLANVR